MSALGAPSGSAIADSHHKDLAQSIDELALDGIQVVPSTKNKALPSDSTGGDPVAQGASPHKTDAHTVPGPAAAAVTAAAVTMPSAASNAASHLEPPAVGSTGKVQPAGTGRPTPARQNSYGVSAPGSGASTPARPAAPEHKKSLFDKLFHHKEKDHSKDHKDHLGGPAAGTDREHLAAGNDGRGRSGSSVSRGRGYSSTSNSTPYASGAESDSSHPATSVSTSTNATRDRSGSTHKTKEERPSFSSFLGRRSSNKKMDKPDPTLAAMARSASAHREGGHAVVDSQQGSPNGSQVTLHHTAGGLLPPTGSTAASRGSTPDMSAVATRPGTASPSRHPSDSHSAAPAGKAPVRRPSGGGALEHFKDKLQANGTPGGSGTHTPAQPEAGSAPHREKTFKEQLAMLGSVSKLSRKPSNASRRSDDGKSEDHNAAPKRAPSVGGQSNASTSLLQKYGVCEKVAIGKGATAVVRLAHKWDRSTEKLYAVKEFRKRRKNETEKEYVKKLTSEFCISSTLHHTNVVETVDLVQNEEKHWCEVMEYCPGGDLYAAIKKGDMDATTVNSYFKQIATGVAYLHSMGVAHRDIKPENLLLDNQGHIKITDFGVSDVFRMCWEKQTHMSKGLCGSEPYIAPEQFEQKGEANAPRTSACG